MGILSREKVGITVLSNEVEVQGGRAVQSVSLILTGKQGKSLLPDESSRKSYLLRWQKREGKWKLREIQEQR
jgi:hypothetical protein